MLDVWAEDAQSEIDRLTRELAEAKARAIDWITHPETIEAKRQWDAVAEALGADKDCPDSVLRAAKARAGSASLPDGWVPVPVEPTGGMVDSGFFALLEAETDDNGALMFSAAEVIYRAMLSARPESPPNCLPSKECPTCYADGVYDTDGNGPMDCYTCGKKAARKEPSDVE